MAFYPVQPLPDTNARSPSITVRPSSTALLTIDSEDRYSNYTDAGANPTSPYNFAIRKSENLMAGFFTRLAVTEVNFPWTIPNINKKTDKIVVIYIIAGTPATTIITIPKGFYTPSQLASQIQTAVANLNPALSTFQFEYGRAYVPGISGEEPVFAWDTGSNANIVGFSRIQSDSQDYPYPDTTKQLFELLGFDASVLTPIRYGQGGYTFCQAIRYIDIVCNQITSVASLKDNTSQPVVRDMLCRLYLGDGGGTGQSTTRPTDPTFCPPGCMPMTIYRAFPHPKQIAWIPNQNIGGFLQFSVYDDSGDLLGNSIADPITTYNQDTNWSMSLLVSEN